MVDIEEKYASQGIEVEGCQGKVTLVRLSFRPAQWADLLNGEGRYLTHCCGRTTRVRGILAHALAQDGWLDVNTLQQAATTMEEHGDFTCRKIWLKSRNPLVKLIAVWRTVCQDAWLDAPNERDPYDCDDALTIVRDSAADAFVSGIFDHSESDPDCALRARADLGMMAVALDTLSKTASQISPGTTTGWVLWRNGKFYTVGGGSPLSTRNLDMARRWLDVANGPHMDEEGDGEWILRRACFSAHGIELLDVSCEEALKHVVRELRSRGNWCLEATTLADELEESVPGCRANPQSLLTVLPLCQSNLLDDVGAPAIVHVDGSTGNIIMRWQQVEAILDSTEVGVWVLPIAMGGDKRLVPVSTAREVIRFFVRV